MLLEFTWCITFLTAMRVKGFGVDAAEHEANEVRQARSKRTSGWIAGPTR